MPHSSQSPPSRESVIIIFSFGAKTKLTPITSQPPSKPQSPGEWIEMLTRVVCCVCERYGTKPCASWEMMKFWAKDRVCPAFLSSVSYTHKKLILSPFFCNNAKFPYTPLRTRDPELPMQWQSCEYWPDWATAKCTKVGWNNAWWEFTGFHRQWVPINLVSGWNWNISDLFPYASIHMGPPKGTHGLSISSAFAKDWAVEG